MLSSGRILLVVGVVLCFSWAWALGDAPDNILVNGSFEQGEVGASPPGWGKWERGPSTFVTVEGGRDGGKMAMLERSPANKTGFVLAEQYVRGPFKVGRVLRISAWMRADAPIERVELVIFMLANGADLGQVRKRFAVDMTWKQYEAELDTGMSTTEDATNLRAIVQLYQPDVKLYVDDVVVAEAARIPEEKALYRDVVADGAEADAIVLADGSILVVFGGGVPRGRISQDGGKTWGKAFNLQIAGGQQLTSCWSLLRLKSGAIGLINGHGTNPTNMFCVSRDEGKTWSEPRAIAPKEGHETLVRNGTPIVLAKGRILVPACSWKEPWNEWSFVYVSDDEGQTWQRSQGEIRVHHEGETISFVEPAVVELKDGRVLMLGRTPLARLFQSFSSDGGLTWSDPEPTELTAAYAPACVRRIPKTGDLLVIWNQASVEEVKKTLRRHRLSCAVSKDEGKTWEHFRNLESLDDTTYVEQPVNWDWRNMEHEPPYKQPEDRVRYHRAPGPLRCAYPSCCFTDGQVVVSYDYGCDSDPLGHVFTRLRVLPIGWFYGE
ncbi:MAG: exo-alpha-sialidase [Planctomycetota bacterium]